MKIAIISQHIKEPIVDRRNITFGELDVIANSSCSSVYLADTLDFVLLGDRIKFFSQAIQKVRYGGELIIRGLDLIEISRKIFIKELNIQAAQHVLYNNRSSAETINSTIDFLKTSGFDISSYHLDDMFYHIEARRPNA